ncbi:MAG: FHA domain-containing protein [Pseudomonadota bacterium]
MAPVLSRAITSDCCVASWKAEKAPFCGECGSPILMCMAHEECGGALDRSGLCAECVHLGVLVDAGAVSTVQVGGALSLPLIIENRSDIARPVFVTGVWTHEPGEDWEAVDLPWERLDAGAQAPISVRADALDKPGTHRLGVRVAVATRWRWREERYLFECGVVLTVEKESATTVNQSITLQADSIGDGATVYNPVRITSETDAKERASLQPVELPMVRAERAERAQGIRGYGDAPRFPRGARLEWRGFPAHDRPDAGPIATEDAALSFGRSRAKKRAGPNDVRLLVDAPGGGLDEDASMAISRRHFEIYVENDRLMLRVESENGVRLNDEPLARGQTAALKDGDQISPLPKRPDALSVSVRFNAYADEINAAIFTRQPAFEEV